MQYNIQVSSRKWSYVHPVLPLKIKSNQRVGNQNDDNDVNTLKEI
jgi:hypothetical protein